MILKIEMHFVKKYLLIGKILATLNGYIISEELKKVKTYFSRQYLNALSAPYCT